MASITEPVSNLELAGATLRPIEDVAADLGLGEDELELYGRDKAKVPLPAIERRRDVPPGRLVAVTGITPTPLGEGKTTVSIGLADAFARSERRAVVCLREAVHGPGLRHQRRRRRRWPVAGRPHGGSQPPLHW